MLTRVTMAITILLAVPAFVLGPWLVEVLYGSDFAEAGVALRWILPGIVAYSVVAVLSKYLVGGGRPGLATSVMLTGLAVNIVSNVVLIPALGIIGAAASSSISYWVTAVLIVTVFLRLSGRGLAETLVLRPRDIARARQAFRRRRPDVDRRLPGPAVARSNTSDPAAGSTGEPAQPGPGEEP